MEQISIPMEPAPQYASSASSEEASVHEQLKSATENLRTAAAQQGLQRQVATETAAAPLSKESIAQMLIEVQAAAGRMLTKLEDTDKPVTTADEAEAKAALSKLNDAKEKAEQVSSNVITTRNQVVDLGDNVTVVGIECDEQIVDLEPDVHLVEAEGLQDIRDTCALGHALLCFMPCRDDRGYGCDICGCEINKGDTMWGCRICNYDKCTSCVVTQPLEGLSTKDSVTTLLLTSRTQDITGAPQKTLGELQAILRESRELQASYASKGRQ